MPPKNKGKPKAKDAEESNASSSKLKPATHINVRHILVAKHSQKEAALEKIREGAKFDDVAREMSEDKARQGGSLGWKVRGSLLQDFEKVAFALDVSTVQKPVVGEVKTSEGWHLIMVEGRR